VKIWVRRGLDGFQPIDEEGSDFFRTLEPYSIAQATITIPRNLAHHRKFFALLNVVYKSCGNWKSVDHMLIELKFRLGMVELVTFANNTLIKVPASISFAKMDQAEFNKFYDRALVELCDMAGGIKEDELRNAIMEQIAAA